MQPLERVSIADQQYFRQFKDGYCPYSQHDLNLIAEHMEPLVREFERPRILEVGCASGQFSSHIVSRFEPAAVEFVGIDIALEVLTTYPFQRVCGTAFQMPFQPRSFDIVCFPASLHHLYPFEVAVRELTRILRPGGYMFCVEPNLYHPQRVFMRYFPGIYQRFWRNANDVPISPYALRALLARNDIDTVKLRFVTIEFASPGPLQQLQNWISSLGVSRPFHPVLAPWFIYTARKKGTRTRGYTGQLLFACPECRSDVVISDRWIECSSSACAGRFPVVDDIPVFIDQNGSDAP